MPKYFDNGYLNFDYIKSKKCIFNFLIGGRGCGKTYACYSDVIDNHTPFALFRRTAEQLHVMASDMLNPFNAIRPGVVFQKINKYIYELQYKDEPAGVAGSISTFANLRGFSGDYLKVLIYDEFIPEPHERVLRSEGVAVKNIYETINRNRELQGLEPLRCYFLTNSNDIASPLLVEFNLVTKIYEMQKAGILEYISPDKRIGVFLFDDSPISKEKAGTALYVGGENTAFNKMALSNDFNYESGFEKKSLNLKNCKPVFTIGELTAYRHTGTGVFYITGHRSGSCPVYTLSAVDKNRCKRENVGLFLNFLKGKTVFENLMIEVLFTRYFNFDK